MDCTFGNFDDAPEEVKRFLQYPIYDVCLRYTGQAAKAKIKELKQQIQGLEKELREQKAQNKLKDATIEEMAANIKELKQQIQGQEKELREQKAQIKLKDVAIEEMAAEQEMCHIGRFGKTEPYVPDEHNTVNIGKWKHQYPPGKTDGIQPRIVQCESDSEPDPNQPDTNTDRLLIPNFPIPKQKKKIILWDWENVPKFLDRLPGKLMDAFVCAFYGKQWHPPELESYVEKGMFHSERCGNLKDAADVGIILAVKQLNDQLHKDIPFFIVSDDGIFESLQSLTKQFARRITLVQPFKEIKRAMFLNWRMKKEQAWEEVYKKIYDILIT